MRSARRTRLPPPSERSFSAHDSSPLVGPVSTAHGDDDREKCYGYRPGLFRVPGKPAAAEQLAADVRAPIAESEHDEHDGCELRMIGKQDQRRQDACRIAKARAVEIALVGPLHDPF